MKRKLVIILSLILLNTSILFAKNIKITANIPVNVKGLGQDNYKAVSGTNKNIDVANESILSIVIPNKTLVSNIKKDVYIQVPIVENIKYTIDAN